MSILTKACSALDRLRTGLYLCWLRRQPGVVVGRVTVEGIPLIDVRNGGQLIIGDNVRLKSRNADYHVNMFAQVSHMGSFTVSQTTAQWLLPTALHIPLRRLAGEDLVPHWINMAWFKSRGVVPTAHEFSATKSMLRDQLRLALEGRSGLAHLLRYEDRNSMAFPIESRVPWISPGCCGNGKPSSVEAAPSIGACGGG